jgi:hypothetical protein
VVLIEFIISLFSFSAFQRMYKNFEGDYRRRPQQNLAGASRKDGRHELLTKAQEERRRRQVRNNITLTYHL